MLITTKQELRFVLARQRCRRLVHEFRLTKLYLSFKCGYYQVANIVSPNPKETVTESVVFQTSGWFLETKTPFLLHLLRPIAHYLPLLAARPMCMPLGLLWMQRRGYERVLYILLTRLLHKQSDLLLPISFRVVCKVLVSDVLIWSGENHTACMNTLKIKCQEKNKSSHYWHWL